MDVPHHPGKGMGARVGMAGARHAVIPWSEYAGSSQVARASKNHYQDSCAELYRRFGVSSYKLIRQEQSAGGRSVLDDWRQTNGD